MGAAPEGYVATRLSDPFEIHVGPIFEKGEKGSKSFALKVDPRHVNMRGVVHGGMLLTFADAAFGQAAWDATERAPSVTLEMQAQFLRSAALGDLIEVRPELTRKTRALLFIRGDFRVGDETVFTLSSVWKLLGER